MIAAIYIRKSREDKDKTAHRLTVQREQLPEVARAQGWEPRVYDDGHASAAKGKADSLPERGRLAADIKKGQISVVLVIELSRLSRDDTLEDYLSWLNLCAEHGVKLATPSRTLDPAQHSDWMLLLMEGGFSSVEMKVLQARMAEGRREAFVKGRWLGGTPPPPYIYDKAQGRPVVDPALLADCQTVWQMVETMSAKAVAEQTGRAEITVRRMIADDRLLMYQAKRIDPENGQELPGDWEPVMTPDQAERIRSARHTRKTNTTRRQAASLLSAIGLFFCGYCGRTVKTWSNSKTRLDGARHDYYGCQVKNIKGACPKSRNIQQRDVDPRLINNVLTTLASADTLQAYWQQSQATDQGNTLADLGKHLATQQQQKTNLVEAITLGVLDFSDAKTKMQAINDTIKDITTAIRNEQAALQQPPNWQQLTITADKWNHLDLLEQRHLLQLVLARIDLFHAYAVITYRFPRAADGSRQSRINLPPRHPNNPKKAPNSTRHISPKPRQKTPQPPKQQKPA